MRGNLLHSPCRKSWGKMLNLHRICAKIALKLRALSAENRQKLPASCAQMFCGCDEKFFPVLFKKYSTVTITTEFFV